MNLKEAYSILDLPQAASPDEAKKKYRELTKKFHPDVNKEDGAEDKFKKINEAYQVVSSGKGTDREVFAPSQRSWNPFGQQREVENIQLTTTISFKDSVFGSKTELKYTRTIKCQTCQGQGQIPQNNGCDKCGGHGLITKRQGNMVMTQTCDKCWGKTKAENCNNCQAKGTLQSESTVGVTIPGGITDGQILRMGHMGNFAGSFGPLEQYSDVYLTIRVTPQPGLSIREMDVVSTLDITLLDALRGCQRIVQTVLGEKEITVKPLSRNKDEVVLPNLGVNKAGNHKVILDIKYPDDIDKLIGALT
jgi:molecular chaperone DnaJ